MAEINVLLYGTYPNSTFNRLKLQLDMKKHFVSHFFLIQI